jgi:hypothetical protein
VLGKGGPQERATNLSALLDGYFAKGGHHINVNVLNREMLMVCAEVFMVMTCILPSNPPPTFLQQQLVAGSAAVITVRLAGKLLPSQTDLPPPSM